MSSLSFNCKNYHSTISQSHLNTFGLQIFLTQENTELYVIPYSPQRSRSEQVIPTCFTHFKKHIKVHYKYTWQTVQNLNFPQPCHILSCITFTGFISFQFKFLILFFFFFILETLHMLLFALLQGGVVCLRSNFWQTDTAHGNGQCLFLLTKAVCIGGYTKEPICLLAAAFSYSLKLFYEGER